MLPRNGGTHLKAYKVKIWIASLLLVSIDGKEMSHTTEGTRYEHILTDELNLFNFLRSMFYKSIRKFSFPTIYELVQWQFLQKKKKR
jgi:hypothetical protein